MKKNYVHIVGTGTIGEPLTGLFLSHQKAFGIDRVSFHKRTPLLTDRSKVINLINRGAILVCDEGQQKKFQDLGMDASLTMGEALEETTVVIDCTPIGNQMKINCYNSYKDQVKGFIAQGSEFGFGKMYARGINDDSLHIDHDQFIQVVSCNTHNLAVITETIAQVSEDPNNLLSGRFLCLRRANDISQDESFIPAPMVGKHDDPQFGTHHARDLWELYQTIQINLNDVFSSSIKLPSQYMHAIHFQVKLRQPIRMEELLERISNNQRLAVTHKTSSNSVFSFGRDHGHFGRILNQTVFCLPSLHISSDGLEVTGFCFTPQDGNSLLSSVSATLWFLDPKTYQQRLQSLAPTFFDEI